MENKLIFIGQHGTLSDAVNGEIVKNRLLVKRFRELFSDVLLVDLYDFKRHFLSFIIRFFWVLFTHPMTNVVFSCSSDEGYRFVRLFSLINRKNVYYWVVGGSFADRMLNHDFNIAPYRKLKRLLVQSDTMVYKLKSIGLNQSMFIRNTKPIDYLPSKHKINNGLIRFVFISRVSVAKGCDYIFRSVEALNNQGYKNRFTVTFYGMIEDGYNSFLEQINAFSNTEYAGFLELESTKNYDILSKFDAMLFPTYWKGEGFAGVFIDAFIAGLPIIASDWNCNKEFITDDIGFIVPTHDVNALTLTMRKIINGEVDLDVLSSNCQKKAMTYDINSVISMSELKRIGLM